MSETLRCSRRLLEMAVRDAWYRTCKKDKEAPMKILLMHSFHSCAEFITNFWGIIRQWDWQRGLQCWRSNESFQERIAGRRKAIPSWPLLFKCIPSFIIWDWQLLRLSHLASIPRDTKHSNVTRRSSGFTGNLGQTGTGLRRSGCRYPGQIRKWVTLPRHHSAR
jgi:hypothetical protein